MKKFLAGLATAAILSMPMAASALEAMNNSQLKSATGQAGVSIAVDDIVIYQEALADVTYWDNDGLSSGSGTVGDITKAGIKIQYGNNLKKLTTINAILDANKYGTAEIAATFGMFKNGATKWEDANNNGTVDTDEILDANGDAVADGLKSDIGIVENAAAALQAGMDPSNGNIAGMTSGISPLTIDVGTCQALTAGWKYNTGGNAGIGGDKDVAGVVIGLPTVEITTYHTNEVKDIKVVVADASQAMNATHNTLISIEKSGYSKMAILGGRLEIAPH